jgi:adenylate cyclase
MPRCARERVPLDLLARAFEAVALPRPRPDDPAPPDIGEVLAAARWALDSGVGEEEFVRSARIYGESMYRVAQAEPARWHEYIEMPLLRAGMSERQMQEIAYQTSPLVRQMVERMILWVYRRHQAHFSIDHMVQHVEAAAEEQGLVVGRPERNPAIAFLDLTGYTRLTEEAGDEAAADLAARLADMVHDLAAPNGGRAVKFLGDGVMFHFAEPAGAVVAVLEMVDRTSRVALPPAHVGVSTGPLVTRDGDYFGRTVNVASRIAAYAGPGQVLVSAEVAAAARPKGVTFDPIGEVNLKGLLKAVDLHRAVRAPAG